MDRPTRDIDGCRTAHARMAELLPDITDAVARRPSLLPEWSIGHVVTHLARNAEVMCRRIDAATRHEVVEQYAGGAAGRAAEIDAGAVRPAHQIVSDALHWAGRLDDVFADLPDDCWARPVRTVRGDQHPVALLPFRRWREVEVHLVDLGLRFTAADWSQELVDRALPRLLAELPRRTDARGLMTWLLGRGSPPELDPWA